MIDALVQNRKRARNKIRKTLDDEVLCATHLFRLTRADSLIGVEASNQYYYLPQDLSEKAIDCRYLMERFSRN